MNLSFMDSTYLYTTNFPGTPTSATDIAMIPVNAGVPAKGTIEGYAHSRGLVVGHYLHLTPISELEELFRLRGNREQLPPLQIPPLIVILRNNAFRKIVTSSL